MKNGFHVSGGHASASGVGAKKLHLLIDSPLTVRVRPPQLTNSGNACRARQRESGTNRFILYANQFRKLNGPVSAVKCCTLSEQSAVISDSVAPPFFRKCPVPVLVWYIGNAPSIRDHGQ